jgi:ABC-type multidrug transport system ATPase subunit
MVRVDFNLASSTQRLNEEDSLTKVEAQNSATASVDSERTVDEPKIAVEVVWKNIEIALKTKDKPIKLVQRVSGKVNAGDFLAIVGSHKSGKTTFIDFLAGKILRYDLISEGEKLVNGKNTRESKNYLAFTAYVAKNEIFLKTVTVKESLEYATRLKYHSDPERCQRRVNELLDDYNLRHISHVRCESRDGKNGGLTPGERKRLAIAIEAVNNPSLFFLNDPTANMSMSEAEEIVKLLDDLKQKGNTIVASFCNVNSFMYDMFDRVMILCMGREIYNDTAKRCIEYLGSIDYKCPKNSCPLHYFMSLTHPDSYPKPETKPDEEEKTHQEFIEELAAKHVEKTKYRRNDCDLETQELTDELVTQRKFKAGFFTQLNLLLHRTSYYCIRQFTYDIKSMFYFTICGLLMSGFFYEVDNDSVQDYVVRANVMFYMASLMVLGGIFHYTWKFPEERNVVVYEQSIALYSIIPYFLAKVLSEIPFSILQPLFFLLGIYWQIPLADTLGAFYAQYGTLFFAYQLGAVYAFFIGVFITEHEHLFYLLPVVNFVLMLISGFYSKMDYFIVSIEPARFVSPVTYVFNVMMHIELDSNEDLIYPEIQSSDLKEDLWGFAGTTMKTEVAFICMAVIYAVALMLSLLGLVFTTKTI